VPQGWHNARLLPGGGTGAECPVGGHLSQLPEQASPWTWTAGNFLSMAGPQSWCTMGKVGKRELLSVPDDPAEILKPQGSIRKIYKIFS